MKTEQIRVPLEPDFKNNLFAVSKASGMPVAEIARRAIASFLPTITPKPAKGARP